MSPLTILLIGVIVILVLIAVGVFISSNSERTLVEDRLGRYLEEDKGKAAADKKAEASSPLQEWVNKRVENSSFGERIAKNLARADLKFKSGEFVGFILILSLALGSLGFIFTDT